MTRKEKKKKEAKRIKQTDIVVVEASGRARPMA